MPKKAKRHFLFIAGTNCDDPSREAEFNKWYDTHIKEAIQHNNFLNGIRYKVLNPPEGFPKYLALYELEDEATFERFLENRRKRSAGLAPKLTEGPPFTIVWDLLCKPI